MKKIISLIGAYAAVCFFLIQPIIHKKSLQGIICVPIADLLGQPIHTIRKDSVPSKVYSSMSVCNAHASNTFNTCPRLHQLLYNDIITVIETTKDEACIEISHAYYDTENNNKYNKYWTLRKNLIVLDEQHIKKKSDQNTIHIPLPLNFLDNDSSALCNQQIVTLIEPHYDTTLHLTFSAGTRFVRCPLHPHNNDKKHTLKVFALDFTTMKEYCIHIPKRKCTMYNPSKTHTEKITEFLTILKKWAQGKKGYIPYVWGGTSYTYRLKSAFKEITKTTENGDYSYYEYQADMHTPKSGFDCSGMILRAAQLAGIPYFYKNTTTISNGLTPLADESLSPGDLIVIRGHVMVVSDIIKNLLIEARSYGHGYGKIHEIPLSDVFESISTYADLIDAYRAKKVVKRKDKNGIIRDTFKNVQLFSLKSVWKDNEH